MAAHTSWASEAPALNQTAAFKVEDAASAEVALDDRFLGFGLPFARSDQPMTGFQTE